MADSAVKRALIVVDMQEDFCPPNGSLPVPQARSITPLVNSLLSLSSSTFPLKIATKDWHPPSHISFATNHANSQPFVSTTTITNPSKPLETYTTRLWPPHCIQSTPGASLIPELDTTHLTHIIEKGRNPSVEMYSAFYDPFKVSDSGLATILKDAKVKEVYVVGLAGDYCVRSTAADAVKEGFETYVIEEGTRPVDVEGWEGCKKAMEETEEVKVVGRESEIVRRLFGEI